MRKAANSCSQPLTGAFNFSGESVGGNPWFQLSLVLCLVQHEPSTLLCAATGWAVACFSLSLTPSVNLSTSLESRSLATIDIFIFIKETLRYYRPRNPLLKSSISPTSQCHKTRQGPRLTWKQVGWGTWLHNIRSKSLLRDKCNHTIALEVQVERLQCAAHCPAKTKNKQMLWMLQCCNSKTHFLVARALTKMSFLSLHHCTFN